MAEASSFVGSKITQKCFELKWVNLSRWSEFVDSPMVSSPSKATGLLVAADFLLYALCSPPRTLCPDAVHPLIPH